MTTSGAGDPADAGPGRECPADAEPGRGDPAGPGTGDGEARMIAERVRACPGVVGLSGGPFGTVATYMPGERLLGVSVNDREVEIAVVARMDRPLPETADDVRRAVTDLAGDRRVNVRIDDIMEEP
ncbi:MULTISPECIES: Asp23/Gls24 family envelope stress response protein [unclassified Nonomuraea]|uniref:Asp23/Gls24 family envelope stress response protein n=1 Tax=unclassified Nonomuraea TaxID=2593643 RepID=UPI001F3A5D02|nr:MULTISPECIES: Asp23/Gls24 family envelope stress response protein [unclassified Nonomuraea]